MRYPKASPTGGCWKKGACNGTEVVKKIAESDFQRAIFWEVAVTLEQLLNPTSSSRSSQ